MNDIINIYLGFSTSERKDFVLFLKRRNRRSDTKNLELISLIEEGKYKGLELELYGKKSKGAYHALCKRVLDTIIDFIASKSFAQESSKEMDVLKLVLAGRLFFEQKLYKIAFKTINKAEAKAIDLDNYAILNEIYHTKIQYAHLNSNWLLEDIIITNEKNQRLAQQDLQLNLAYAKIKEDLQKESSLSIHNVILEAFSRFKLEITEALTYKSLYQLMEITATTAKLQSDFYSISPYMFELFNKVEEKGIVPEKHKYYYLNMLYLMAVTEFRNKRFNLSKLFLNRLNNELELGKSSYERLFMEKLNELHALNEIYTGNHQVGITILERSFDSTLNKDLLLAMCYFQQEAYNKAYAIIIKLNRTDEWYLKKMGWTWVLKKNIIEVLLLIELDKLETVLNRFDRFSRNFNKKLIAIGERRVLVFMELVKELYGEPNIASTSSFKEKVENSFDWLGREQEDIFVMSFYAWLKSKMENRKLYEVTLDLVTIPYQA